MAENIEAEMVGSSSAIEVEEHERALRGPLLDGRDEALYRLTIEPTPSA